MASRLHGLCVLGGGDFLADSFHAARCNSHMMIFFLLKAGYFFAALGEHGKGRGLHPPHVQGLAIKDAEKPGRVDTDKPIGLCPT
jgi:hypothetical protein